MDCVNPCVTEVNTSSVASTIACKQDSRKWDLEREIDLVDNTEVVKYRGGMTVYSGVDNWLNGPTVDHLLSSQVLNVGLVRRKRK